MQKTMLAVVKPEPKAGSEIREVVYPLDGPNGVGLSPDGKRIYAAETYTGRVFAWELSGKSNTRRPLSSWYSVMPSTEVIFLGASAARQACAAAKGS